MVRTASQPPFDSAPGADFVFEGVFEDRPVQWHCHLVTLAAVAAQTRQALQHQFIEIDPQPLVSSGTVPGYQITVGLNVPVIDQAVIEKTIIMIRNYRRLRGGRHEYGEQVRFALD